MRPCTRFVACVIAFLFPLHACFAIETDRADVRAFIDELVAAHDYDRAVLESALASAERQQKIIDAISSPAEKKLNWAEYRKIFLTPERIAAGARFWREHEQLLCEVATSTGVPEDMLVGIIGVETYFGRITGNYRVLDALSTLAFDYPPRSAFFRKELAQFFLLVREEELSPEVPTGSYAGAMGRPQFMPSSFRAYAYDTDGDGKRDIWEDWGDVAGSIANYFNAHGWRAGEEVVAQATLGDRWQGAPPAPANVLSANATIGTLSDDGVLFATDLPVETAVALLALDGDDGAEFWVAMPNFFVITKYNRSAMYALAVHQLGQAIAAEVRDAGE